MHETARVAGGASPAPLLGSAATDACLRVAYEADAPIQATLVDGAGHVLGESGPPALEGVVGQQGPVCVRKGDSVVGVPAGNATHVRWIAWQAP
jgi:hypothetical protein